MVSKNTSLSKIDVSLLEEAVVRYGRIVTSTQILALWKEKYASNQAIKNRISFLCKSGWLVRVKKGLYVVVTDLSTLAFNDLSGLAIAQALNNNSYISFENALAHYGMFDQMLDTVDAVTFQRARKYHVQNMQIRFFTIRKDLYFGFVQARCDAGLVNVATKEKALLDILYFRSGLYAAALVWEKLKEHKGDVDFNKVKEFAVKFGIGMVRKIGFFLDSLGVDTTDLAGVVSGKTGYAKMSKESKIFNAKWRVYYDDKLII
jgi:predicted transcriptional regulator of viral defense system